MFFFFIRKVECHLVPLHSRERERADISATKQQHYGKREKHKFFLVLGVNWPFKKNATVGAEANQPEVRP